MKKKDRIYITDVKEVYGAMNHGLQVFCKDGTSWFAVSFKIGKLSIIGDFVKAED